MPRLIVFVWMLMCIVQGCGVLSKSQVRRSKNYFETVTNYSSLVRRSTETLANLNLESKTLQSALETSNQERINVVIHALSEYEMAITPPDSIERSLVYLERYVQGYYLLVTNGFDTYSQLKASTAMVPFGGVAVAIGSLLRRKEPGVRPRKRDNLKKHLEESHDSIRLHLNRIQQYLAHQMTPAINKIETETKRNFEFLLQSINRNNEPIDFYQNYNRELSRFYQKLYLQQKIINHLDVSLTIMLEAENEVVSKIKERQKIEPESETISSLLREIERTKTLLQRL